MDQNQNRFHPVLPRLKRESRVGNFQNFGRWDIRNHTELEILSGGLDVEKVEFEVNSIPDMWARPLLFEMALFDRNHALHSRIRGEWRGLLAILALRELRVINISVRQVTIPTDGEEGEDEAKSDRTEQANSPNFLNALSKLTPRKSLSTDTTWHNLYVFLMRNRPIGMTSPNTLVCTATECYNRIDGVPWFDGRFLNDPKDQLSFPEKQALAGWLQILIDNLQDHEGLQFQTREWNALLGLIQDFIADLGGTSERLPPLSEMGLQMNTGFYIHLNHPAKGADDGDPTKSHVRLLPSRKNEPPVSILVVDSTIADQWRLPEHDIIVYGSVPLETAIPFSGLSKDRSQIAGQTLKNAEVWSPKDFFTKKLFVINQQDAFPGAMKIKNARSDMLRYQNQLVTPIFPIEKKLIDYLSLEDLSRRISFEQSNDGIIVRLRLLLSGPDGTGREFDIRQEYRTKENELILVESVPVLEVWPDFVTRDGSWKSYYTYYSAEGVVNTFAAEPYTPGATSEPQTFSNNRGEVERTITRTDIYPEIMVCKAPVANPETNRMELEPAGIMLIEYPKDAGVQRNHLTIGIDFGTTSTNVYVKEQNSDPSQVAFKDHLRRVTESGDIRSSLYYYFLPDEEQKIPFLSFFHDFNKAFPPDRIRPLLDGHIFFLRNYEVFDASKRDGGEIATDLKWSAKDIDQFRARAFLDQICLQAAAEAVLRGANQVTWAYSFPTAFSNAVIRQSFPKIWKQVTDACAAATGMTQTAVSPKSKTESVASALYFLKHDKASIRMGTVCIDIGGSTSDIAIWQGNELRWQTSVRLAGRDIFLSFLHHQPEVLQIFGFDIKLLKSAANNQLAFYAQADALLDSAGDRFFELLPSYIGDKRVQQLIQHIAIGLSGLFYYVGLILNYLTEQKIYEKQMPDIYIGGNGAKMFYWLDVGTYNINSPINELFKQALLQASGFGLTEIFKLAISSRPKAEAAYGLVCEDDLKSTGDFEEILAGESFIENGAEQKWNQLLKADRLSGNFNAPQNLDRLTDFLQVFNTYAKSRGAVVSPLSVDASAMRDIIRRLEQSLGKFKESEDPNEIQLEPIFIIALKHLLDVKRVL